MRKTALITLALVVTMPLVAHGGGDHKCEHSVDECLNHMVTKLKSTGFIGVELADKKSGKLIVAKIVPGSPAESAGIKAGDELYSLNGIRFNKENQKRMGQVKKPGNEVQVTIKRDGQAKKMMMTLVAMPADLMAKYIGEHMMSHAKAMTVAKQ